MDPITFAIDERLADAGSTVPLKGHADMTSFELGGRTFDCPAGLDYDLMLTNAGEGILATGIATVHASTACDRCLEKAELDISAEVDEYFLFEEPAASEEDEDDEVDFSLVGDDNTIEVGEPIMAAVLMEAPFVVLCRDDCKGLCPRCGANLNEGPCGCEAMRETERQEQSPFAKLKGLKLDD